MSPDVNRLFRTESLPAAPWSFGAASADLGTATATATATADVLQDTDVS